MKTEAEHRASSACICSQEMVFFIVQEETDVKLKEMSQLFYSEKSKGLTGTQFRQQELLVRSSRDGGWT